MRFMSLLSAYSRQTARPSPQRTRRLCIEPMEGRDVPSAGDLDPTFGAGGKVVTDFLGLAADAADAVAVQPDGRTILAGGSSGRGALARYNPDGTLDPIFGTGGRVLTPTENLSGVTLQADGKIVTVSTRNGDFLVARFNPDGSLDTGFGVGGVAVADFGNWDEARAIAIQTVGGVEKVVVAGSTWGTIGADFAVARYNPDGSLDPTFGTGGKVTTDFAVSVTSLTSSSDRAYALTVTPDNSLVVAGETDVYQSTTGRDFALVRYTADGALDLSFGAGGRMVTDFGSTTREIQDTAYAVTVERVGGIDKIVAVGTTENSAAPYSNRMNLALARYNFDGTPDVGFGNGGRLTTDFGGNERASEVASLGEQGILVAGVAGSRGALVRYRADGSLDPTFDGDGKLLSDRATFAALTLPAADPGGLVVVAGQAGGDFAVARYLADGRPDTTFAGTGTAATGFLGPADDTAQTVLVQGDGKIVAVGRSVASDSSLAGYDFVLARYNPDGSLDPTFGQGGRVRHDFGVLEEAHDAALQRDGKIIVVGLYRDLSNGGMGNVDFAVARYNPDGSPDATFGTGGLVHTDFGDDFGEYATAVAVQGDGKIVVGGVSGTGYTTPTLLRYNPDGTLDPTFGNGGKATAVGIPTDLVIQGNGKILASTGPGFTAVRYNSDGSLDSTFGQGGKATTDMGPYAAAYQMAVQPDGKVVQAGWTQSGIALVRYTAGGVLDTTFDGDGKVFSGRGLPEYFGDDKKVGLALQGDGRIVVAGSLYDANNVGTDLLVLRFNANGSPDPGFGVNGAVTTDFERPAVGWSNDYAFAVAIQGDGKIVAAGATGGDFALARYEGNDDRPRLAVSDVRKKEGQGGVIAFTFTITLSAPALQTVTVNYMTADSTAKAGSDYQATSGTLTFAPGETSKTVTVWVTGDKLKESDETFFLNLSAPSNALLEDGQGLGTILNDDR